MKKLLCVFLSVMMMFSAIIVTYADDEAEFKIGDCNLDGVVSIIDATDIQIHIAGISELSETSLKYSDVDSSSKVDILDATIIQQFVAQLITEFPTIPEETQPSTSPIEPTTNDKELLEVAQKVTALQNENTLTFSLISDVHYTGGNLYDKQKLSNISKMGELQDLTQVDFIANLGDFVNGDDEKEKTVASLTELLGHTKNASKVPVFNVRGNHDDNGDYTYGQHGGSNKIDEIINDKEWCELAFSNLPEGFVIDENNPYGGYGYFDHEKSKIRIFVLNSVDIPYILDGDTYRYNSYTGNAFSDNQLDFVANSLLFSDKENPNDWAALFLTHVPLDTSNANGECFGVQSELIRANDYMLCIIEAYRKGISFKAEGTAHITGSTVTNDRPEDFKVSVDIDYSQKGSGEVIGFFSGHTHTDNVSKTVDIENSLAHGYAFVGLSGSTSFTNYVIDRNTKTISAIKYGNTNPETDENREIGTPDTGSIKDGEWSLTYDHFLPKDESIYNGVSKIYPIKTYFDGKTTLNLDTLELENTTPATSLYLPSMGIRVKPFTTYVIPDDYMGTCVSFNRWGSKNPAITPVDHGDYKTVTTNSSSYFLAFFFYTKGYANYDTFYVKELSCNTTFK